MKRIVWIASYPKSGNTWVRLFIAALRYRSGGGAGAYDPNTISKQEDFHQDNARHFYEPLFRGGWDAATKSDMAHARPVVHRWIANNAKKSTPIVKTHNAAINVNGIPVITPDATRCAICIVRHPYDVAISVKDHFGARDYDHAIEQMVCLNYTQPKDARFIDAPIGSWSQNVRSWTEKADPKIHVFRYEDMVDAPMESFTRIAGILGIRNKQAIEQAITNVDITVLRETEARAGFVERSSWAERFFARGKPGFGREMLTDAQKRVIAEATSKAAALHGYEM